MDKKELIDDVRIYLSAVGKINEKDEKILEAIEKINRKRFMEKNKELAYENEAIPIGHGQTISQPSTVARMLSLLELKKTDNVLEVGTGSLWNAALLGFLAKKVLTLEIVKELAELSKKKVKRLNLKNIKVRREDFRLLKEKFDKIIFTAGIYFEQEGIIRGFAKNNLKPRGILICPHRSGPLLIIKKDAKGNIKKSFTREHYAFVPLILS